MTTAMSILNTMVLTACLQGKVECKKAMAKEAQIDKCVSKLVVEHCKRLTNEEPDFIRTYCILDDRVNEIYYSECIKTNGKAQP